MEELIKLAEEKGFQAKTVTTKYTIDVILGGRKNILINDTCNYLILCEIQKWLREVHNIDVYVLPSVPNFKRSNPVYYVRYFQCPKKWELNTPKRIMESESVERRFDNPEQALEAGLLEALKLIKTDE